MNKIWILLLVATLLQLQISCSSESLGSGSGGGGGENECPDSLGNLTVSQPSAIGGSRFCNVGGELTEDASFQELSDGLAWSLDRDLTVSSGTLTINAGVEIFGDGASEYIYIQNGASINVAGTRSSPVMLSQSTSDGSTEWGGLIIESLLSGGTEQSIAYLVVSGAGATVDIGAESYQANISFAGEQHNTEVRFLQSHASASNGIALVSESDQNSALLESILVTSPANEGVLLRNFNGLLKNLMVIQDSNNISAGIHFQGSSSNPLLVNATLIGQDIGAQSGSSKVGFLFDEAAGTGSGFGPRIANSLIVNYQHGCYRVEGTADLSTVDISPIPDESFIDGLHCVIESNSEPVAASILAPSGGINLTAGIVGPGNSTGLSFYENVAANFENEVTTTIGSGGYYLNNIGGLSNGTTSLQRYNSGDTDNDGDTDADDESFGPLLGEAGVYAGISEPAGTLFRCVIPDQMPAGAEFRDEFGDALPTQPTGTALTCGLYVFFPDLSSKFNLTIIGAIESSDDDRFDDWTISGSL